MNALPPEVGTSPEHTVRSLDGVIGVVEHAGRNGGGMTHVRFDNGIRVAVNADMLRPQPDGSTIIFLRCSDLSGGVAEESVLPIVAEELHVTKQATEAGRVAVHIFPQVRDEVVDVSLGEEHVDVERVQVNEFISGPVSVRQEGDVTVVPVIEEVLVVEKRTMLREEIRLTRRRETTRVRQVVPLRSEQARVLRADAPKGARAVQKPAD